MKKNSYIAPRGDIFYYIEVTDMQKLRDDKISNILGESNESVTYFLSGSHKNLNKVDSIEFALFWKNKESAEFRINSLKRHRPRDGYTYLIKSLNRDCFINSIPDNIESDLKSYKKMYLLKNIELKVREISYKRKIENPWR